MAQIRDFYDVYDYGDNIKPGSEIKIEHSVVFREDRADLSPLTALSLDELKSRRESSAAAERAIFKKLCSATSEWEKQAAKTMLIDHAIEYMETPAVEHTANKWQLNKYGNRQEISNMVYKMSYMVYEDTKYDRELQKSVPVAWYLSWDVHTNSPDEKHWRTLGGQDRKRFTDKAAMEKYLQGRIKTYSHLFTEISPPIPQDYVSRFCVNGQLLPGYNVEGQPEKRAEERPSALDKLAAAKVEVAENDAAKPSPDKSVGKSHAEEL